MSHRDLISAQAKPALYWLAIGDSPLEFARAFAGPRSVSQRHGSRVHACSVLPASPPGDLLAIQLVTPPAATLQTGRRPISAPQS